MARPAHSDKENEQMRKRLAKGALELFRQLGHEDVSLRRLAGYAGVSHTLLYRYFENKEGLFTAVRVASLNLLYDMFCQADSKSNPPLVRLRNAAEALLCYGRTYPAEYRFVFSAEQPDLAKRKTLLALRHKVFGHIVEIAQEAKEQGVITMEPRTWVHLAWATLHGILTLNESNQLIEGRSVDDLANSALDLLLGEVTVTNQPPGVTA